MTLEEALKIVDPRTQEEALSVYPGYCGVINARVAEASRIVVDAYKKAKEDMMMVAKEYDCMCMICCGGLGVYGVCPHLHDEIKCNDCGECRCAGCSKADKHFRWRGEA